MSSELVLCDIYVKYIRHGKYLGINLAIGKTFSCCFNNVKFKFYTIFNYIYSNFKNTDSACVITKLMKDYC